MNCIEQLLQARRESGYRYGKHDLVVCKEKLIYPFLTNPFQSASILLQGENPCFSQLPLFSVRSRFAQIGLNMTGLHNNGNNTYIGHVVNHGPRSVYIDQGMPFTTLFDPSIAAHGDQLLYAVMNSIKVMEDDFVIADSRGTVQWRPGQNPCSTDHYDLLGIRINKDEFYEVDPDGPEIHMPQNGSVREAVSQFLRPVQGDSAEHPFAVTSTLPVSLGDMYLTLITHHYYPLYHLSSVVIKPNSNWLSLNGDNSGIRCEYFSLHGLSVQRQDLPDYVFFTVHPKGK